jgi:hypothetical protein
MHPSQPSRTVKHFFSFPSVKLSRYSISSKIIHLSSKIQLQRIFVLQVHTLLIFGDTSTVYSFLFGEVKILELF